MATSVSLATIRKQLVSTRQKLKESKIAHHAGKGFRALGNSMVINSSTAVFSYIQGRTGGVKVGPVPLEVLVGIAFHGVGVFEPGGAMLGQQFHNLGDGAIAAAVSAYARGAGRHARAKAGGKPLMKGVDDFMKELSEGEDGDSGGGALDPDDLMKLAERV